MSQRRLLHLLFQVTFGFVVGIIYATYYPVHPDEFTYLVGAILLTLVTGYLLIEAFEERPSLRSFVTFLLIVALAFLVGLGRYSSSLGRLEENHVSDFTTDDWSSTAVVEGTVTAQPEVERLAATIRVSPEKIWPTKDADQPVEPTGGDIIVKINKDSYQDLSVGYAQAADNDIYGDRLRITGSLMRPFEKSNPGGFSYKTFLRSKGIYGAIWSPGAVERVESGDGNPIVAWALDLQTEMLKTIKMTMPYPHSAFLGGATLGLREGLAYSLSPFGDGDKLISQVFQASGTSHVLAVSGLHVGVIAGAFLALFNGLRIPRKLYAPLVLFALLIFTIITGARPATIRASIMMGLVVVGLAYLDQGLKNSVLFGLCLSALFILLYNPKLIYEASFTLSFSAVLCLALLTGPIERILDRVRDLTFVTFWICLFVTVAVWFEAWNFFFRWYVYLPYFLVWGGIFYVTYRFDRRKEILGRFGFHSIPTVITGFFAAQFAIQLGMMWPLSAYYFQAFPIAGAFANLIAIPLVGVVVPLGLLAGLVGLIPGLGPWLALVVNAGNYLAVTGFLWVTHVFAQYFPYPLVRKMTLFHVTVLYVGLIFLAFWRPILNRFERAVYWVTDNVFHRFVVHPTTLLLAILSIGSVTLFGASFGYEPESDSLQVTVLNVGYGSGIVVRTPDEHRFLFGGGFRKWDWHHPQNLPDRMDKGKQVVASYFLNERIKSLDLVAAQSPEPQHIGGLPVILDHFSVDRVIGSLPEEPLTSFNKENYLKALDNYYYEQNADESWFVNDYFNNWERLWTTLGEEGIPYSRPTRGTTLYRGEFSGPNGKSIRLTVMHPGEDFFYESYASSNRSLVLSLRVEDGPSFLFPGDLREAGQADLVEAFSPEELQHDVLLVPANGMQESSVRSEFVKAVDPKRLVFSTGTPEIKGPLAKKMGKTLEENIGKANSLVGNENIYRTDRDYAVTLTTEGDQVEVSTVAESD